MISHCPQITDQLMNELLAAELQQAHQLSQFDSYSMSAF